MGNYCDLSSNLEVGNNVLVGSKVSFVGGDHKIDNIKDKLIRNSGRDVLKTTIIEDNVFLGAMSEVVEGVIVGEGAVISMGMFIGQSTKIVNRKTGDITYGKVPPYSVVVPGSLPDKKNPNAPSLNCAVIIKQVDEKTRSKTSINDLLRD